MTRPPASAVASQRIADILAYRILSGELAPGSRIKQDELADELAASRIPVREALRILDSRGLVTIRANAGAWVTEMTLDGLRLSYEIRERIEPLLLMESLPHLTPDDLAAMDEIRLEIEGNDDVERFLELDRQFHWLSYSRHQAPQLASMIERLWDTTQHYRRAFVQMSGAQESWIIHSEHRLLLDALRRGDEATGTSVLGLHIQRTRVALASHPELFADQDA